MGIWPYLQRLGLDEQDLYGAEGNAFDHYAVIKRIGQPLADWVTGRPFDQHRFVDPATVVRVYQDLAEQVRAAGYCTEEHPFPLRVRAAIMEDQVLVPAAPRTLAEQHSAAPAAESGRHIG